MEHRQRPHRHDGNNIKIRSLVVGANFCWWTNIRYRVPTLQSKR